MRIIKLAKAMAPSLSHKFVGIRPGEKLHEVMCTTNDSHLTLDFKDHYVICPSIQFNYLVDYKVNYIGEIGVAVDQGYEYSSDTNTKWLSSDEFLKILRDTGCV